MRVVSHEPRIIAAAGTRRAPAIAMQTVKHVLTTIGSGAGDLAKRVGSNSATLAKRVGTRSSHIARDIGAKRALIGLAVAGVAIAGTIFLVRYLRTRRAESSVETDGDEASGYTPRQRKHAQPHAAH